MCTFSPNNLQKNLFRSNIVKSLYVFFIIVFLLLYPGQNKAAGQEIPELKVTSDFSVSVALPRETIIKSIDIDITGYDTSVFEITEITLAGGILENMNYGLADNTTDGQIHIGIYALGNPITGKGDVVFINFDIKGEGNSTTLSFINFQSNELPADGGFSVNDAFFPSLRISINYSPVLDNSQTPEITPIDEDDFENNGTSIAEIIEDGSVTDADGFPTEAMAVTGIDNTNGVWQYSLDNGADWNDFNTETGIIDISANARLLDGTLTGSETHRIRFVPEPDWNSTAVLTFRAWDKNSGTAGQTADATVGGSGLAFSSVTDEAIIEVIAVNDAPVLDTDQSPYLTAIGEKDTENEGNTVSEIIAEDSVTDADGSPARAIAVTSVDNTNGTWQYSVDNGIVWTSFSDAENMLVDISDQARLLGETSRIRFVPGTGWYGTSTFKFCAWDKSIGAAGETGDARTGGGTSEFSFFTDNASIEVTPVNDAPLLDDTFFHVLAAIDENEIENNGNSVAEIISDGSVEDVDGSPAEAIAVIGVNNLNGIWQYSTDNGISWTDFSEQAGVKVYMTGEARLLDETNRIRFVPDTDWNGTSTFTFRAWDMSSGTAGQTANASVGGDTSAFSSVTDKAEIEVSPVNNAPVLDNTESPVLTPIDEDDIENNGNSIAEILAQGSVTDEDGLPEQAIAVTAVDNTDGTWQYSTDNGFTWTDFTAETETEVDISYQARLLDETHKIRFVPNPDWSGTAEFTFRAWDKSSGEPGKTADAGEGGDELPFSLLTDKADINVNPLNDAPVLDNTVSPELSPINVNNDDSEGNSIAQIVTDGSITDADADVPAEAIAVTAVDNTNGKWQFSVNNGAEWKDFTAETGSVIDISANARLLDGSLTHKIRFVPDKDWFGTAAFTFLAWDKTEGKAGETADTGTLDDDSAFSSDADDAGIEVIFTNNAPILDPSQSPELSATDLNDFDSDGNTVAEIVADGSITDEDGLPAEAIAVIAVDNTDGKWEYSLDDGVTWTDFTEQTGEQADISAEARLLDENHKIRFVPDEDWAGIAIFTFRAWDKSIGTAGEIADASTGGDILPFSLATDDASIEVTVSNHAPILDASQSPMLTAIEQDEFESSGNTVSEIVTDGSIFDEDGDAPEAIAVTAVNNTNGTWEYSTDNSSAWILFTGETGKRVDISTQARLLDESCMIRFVPDQEWEGTATFTFLAWDKSTGTAGSTADTSERGGISAFSSDSDDADIEVRSESENYAPVLDTGYFPELSDITRGETDSIGNSIAEIVADGSITDPDGPGLEAIAVTSVDNTRGVWQYSTDNGDSWRDFSPVTGANVAISAQARLLDGTLTGSETHKIRFKPVQDWTGAATFTFRAWDKSSGVAGQTADAGIGGDTSEFSSDTDEASIEVIIDNEAPILNNSYSPALTAINENDFDNNGNSVAEIVADGSITDSDGPAAEAIAVTGVDNTNGKWQYSVDNGAGWKDFSAATGINANISDRARLLDGSLTGAGTHRIRFVPVADWSGSATFKFRAWDKSSGIPGETSVPEEGGGASAFSSDSDNASIVTNPVNDAPTLDNTRNPGLSSITENNFNSQGNTVGEIVADGSVIDTDGPPSEAIAVISVDNTNGTWQYSANNSAWKIFSASKGRVNISDKALLLDENSRIRFVPNNGWNGSASFTFRAWDKSEGTPGGTANASTGGGTSAFSSDTDVAVILVTPAEVKNKAPVLDISQAPMLTGIDEDDFNNNGTSIADIIVNVSITDPDGPDLKSIAVIVVDNTNGMWQYSLNNGGTWSDFSTVRGTKVEILRDALLLDGTITGNITHKVRFVPNPNWNGTSIFSFRAWDKTTGAAGQRTDASAGGGESAFSSNADDAAIKANPVNDAPALDNRHSPALSSINENMFDSNGDSVADIIADRSVADADGSPAEAMAVILVDNSNGVWQYSPDSASWTDFTPSRGSEINISGTARLLDHINRIRFIPNADWSGSSSFTFRAWDKSAGVPGATADADTGGGISPFSSATDKVFITVSDVARAHAGQDRTVEEGEKVILDGSGSSGPIVTYKWTQTSGIPIEISDPTAVSPFFTAPEVDTGIHSLVFMLAVNNNIETQDTVTINVSDIPAPVASLAAEPLSGNTPLEVTFTDMSQGEISQWLWDFGDGYQSITQNPAHTYTSAGTYTVKLTVSGRGGQHTGIRENYITVNNIPLKADFKADPLEGPLPLTVSFTQNSQGEVKEWMWDFGDGKTSSVPDPVHTFEAVGAYTVSLTVKSEEQTVTKTETSYINVIGRIIDGRVTAEDTGQGLANCWVEVWSDNVFQSGASTDQGGYYTITGLPKAGNLILAAWPPEGTSDYYYQYYKGKDNPALADQATTIGGDLTDIDFILKRQPTLGILGTIHDGENPVPGIEVNVFSKSIAFGMNTMTDENGTYAITGLKPADDYKVSVWSEQYETEFYYAIPEQETVGEYIPDASAFSEDQATPVTPEDPSLPNIDIIVNVSQGESIEGYVFDEENTPLENIRVNAWSTESDTGNNALTDETGYYIIPGLEKVTADEAETKGYIVEIRSDDYPYQAYNRAEKPEHAVKIATNVTGVNFYLKTSVVISGVITDQDGNPVTGAEVSAWSLSGQDQKQGSAITDETGAYSITLPAADDYVVGVFSPDFPVQYYTVEPGRETPDTLDLTGGDINSADIVLDKGNVIKGVVYVKECNQGLCEDIPARAGIWVNIWSGSEAAGGDVQTDNQGRYEITGLDKNIIDYVISVRDPGYVPAFYSPNGTVYNWESAGRVAPSVSDDRNIVLLTGFSIKGRVTYNGKPVPGIRAEAQAEDMDGWGSTVTSSDDEFNYIITKLMPGTYNVTIQPENFMDMTQTVIIEDQGVLLDFDLAEEPQRSISGVITGLESGRQVKITAWSLSKDCTGSAQADGTGQPVAYIIAGLKPASDYIVELSSDDYPFQIFDGKSSIEDADYADLSDSNAPGINFALTSATASISGQVIFPGDAVPGETVRIDVFSLTTGLETGVEIKLADSLIVRYEITGLAPDTDNILYLSSDKYMNQYCSGSDYGSPDEEDAVHLNTSENPDADADFRLRRGSEITGRVIDKDDNPVEGINIEAWSAVTGSSGFAVTSENGTYTIEGLEGAYDYIVRAWDTKLGSFFYNSEKTVLDESLAAHVSTSEGNPSDINIRLIELESISGTVTDLEGYPLELMWVEAYSELMQAGGGVFTDEDGSYLINGLPTSRDYTVSARPDWYTVPQEKFNVSSGSSGVNFTLNPREGYRIKGKVTDNQGNAVTGARVEAWSESQDIRGKVWSVTDRSGEYELTGIPRADDYVIMAWPPEDSYYSFFSEEGFSVPLEDDTVNIEMSLSLVINGTVTAKDDGAPMGNVQVIAVSKTNRFQGQAVTDKYGFYELNEVPEGSNYDITAIGGENFSGETKTDQAPGGGIDFVLEKSSSITGTVRNKTTGEPVSDALVEAYSESRQGVTNFDGVGITDENGCYTISGLRSTDQKGSLINDYVVTVHAPGYPNFSKGAKKADDTVDFIISRGKENEIAGTVIGYEGELFDNIDFIADIFNPDGVFITFVIVNKDGTFKFSGLDPEKQYLLKFTAFIGDEEILSQWIGESGEEGYNVGVENPDDPFTPPFSAKAFSTNTTLHFRFSISISDTEIIWSRRVRAGTGKRAGGNPMTEISSTSHTDKVSNNPNVSVTWAPFGENDIGYYYEFNQIPGHIITKRNAPGRPPIKTRQVTSGDMNGDNVSFYFHVAPVDDRGRIGYTATREFRIDTVPPSNGNVIAPETTSDRIISISLGVMDAKEMYISNTGYGQNGEWQTRVKTVQWELAQGEGIKKIYVQFRDEAQNVSNFMVTTEKTDIVENSSPVIEDQEFHVVENSGYGTIIGTIAANDDDEDSLTYTVTAGNTGEVFDVSESTGEIRVLDSSQLDYETISFYTLTVEVSDGLDTDTALITVNISDQDENPPVAEPQVFSVNENSSDETFVGKTEASDDSGGPLEFSITAGNIGDAFAIEKETGRITVRDGTRLDYETTDVYVLTVTVSDGINTAEAVITINIIDVNEQTLTVEDQTVALDENSAKETSVVTVSASGPIETLTYIITAGNTGNAFAIDADSGLITVNDSSQLDYEITQTYTLTVKVSDGTSDAEALITITINNLSEYKPVAENATFSVNENSPAGIFVGKVKASDADLMDTLEFSITAGNAGAFAIDSRNGNISVRNGALLDYEAVTVHTLTVAVSDGINTVSAVITINIIDVNEQVLTIEAQAFSVDENSANETSVGAVVASGPIQPLAYTITEGNTGNAFAIDSSNGLIAVMNSSMLDYETTSSYTLTVAVSDGMNTVSALITINITDVNEQVLTIEAQAFSVDENSANETSVGAVVASGPIQPLAYTITEGNTGNAFAIDSSNGLITVMNSSMLDYETTSSYTLTVAVSDGMNTVSAVITINIIDVNEQVLTVKDQEFSVDENSADNTPVGTVVASGPVEPLTYSITAGNTGDAFAIDSETGVIRVLSSDRLDYETISKYELTVQVSDGALLVEALITITLNDLSEHKPVAENAEFSVDENSAGDTIVGKVTASDADKDTLTYSITTGNTGDAFAINTGNGTIRVSSLLDYETISAYTLTVAVSDGMNTVSAVITINIIDVNEQVLTVKDQEFSVDENSADNTPVGTVVASGPIEPLVYSITAGNTGEAFVINSETGVITVRNSAQLDYETTSEYELTVQVSDGTAVAEALITITLSDLSEHKPVAENAEFSVDENSVGGTVVGKVTASDADTKDTLTYSITAGNTGDVFAIDSETGEITVNSSTQLDYEATEVYTLTVQVSDNINTATALITVNINDVSEDILVVNDQTFQVDENSANGTSVGRIAASGPVDTLTFSITAGNNTGNVFVVDSAAREIRVDNGSMLDYETQPVYTLTLEISDGITTVTPVITINVNDLGEYVPVASDQTFQADENSYNGTIVGTVAASDDDPADILAYRITAGNTGNAFAIDNKTGEITVKDGVQLDYETTPEYVLTVAVSDGTNTITIAVTVMLNDLPEDVLVVKDQAFSVNEDSPEGTSVGKVVASGPAGTLAYLITAGNTDNAFTINGSTGEIILSSSPDYETTPIYVLTVEVSDSISTVSAAITINVVPDAESHKPVTEDQVFSVDESSAAGTFVGVVIATDPDPGDILTYTITAGNEDNAFAIDSQTGVITVSSEQLPDYDTMPVYILTIEVSDGENNADARITVNVLFPLMPDMAWHNPVPTGNTLAGVWGTGGSVFAVGDSGTILYHNGADWSTMENPSFVSLYDVWGTSDTDVFAVGHAGMILHYDGNNWTSMNSGTTETLNAVWGRTGADVFAVGNAGTILHYNGAEWIPMYSATALPLSGIWGDSETVVTVGNSGTILFYDGTEWFAEESGVTENLKGIWGTSGSDLFVAGDGGIILRYDGTNWNKPDTPTDENLMRVWGSSGTDVFAAGEYGVVIHYDGTAWHEMESRTESWIFGLWGDIGSNVFAVGYAGLILRYNGTDWTFKSKGSYDWLKGIWGSSDSDIFAVGGGFDYYTLQPYRTILHYNGASWNSIVDENSDYLYGIWGSSESDIFAVGGTGLILHYDGSEWSTVNSGITEELYSIWGSSGSDIFAVGDMGVILHYNGTEWMETRTGEPGFLSDVWGSSGSDVFAVGSGGMVIHYDGTGWKEMDSSVNTYLYAVCGTSGNNVFAAGDAGTILHYNGTEWMQMETDISEPLVFRDISINSEDVFVAGDNGTILYYNGTEWRKVNVNTHNHFKSVWYATDSIFVVGDTGTILEIGK